MYGRRSATTQRHKAFDYPPMKKIKVKIPGACSGDLYSLPRNHPPSCDSLQLPPQPHERLHQVGENLSIDDVKCTAQGEDISGSLLATSDFVDATVTKGTTYYYVVTAVDDLANGSGYLVQVSAMPEAPPPVTLLPCG